MNPLRLNRTTLGRLERYAKASGKTVSAVANQAVAYWFENHGEIVITTRLHDPRHIAIRIADTGCGIPEENLSKIRDPFFTTKEVGTGTGLGLSIVDEIIRSHRGDLIVESEVGKGSAFTVVLPIKQTAAPTAEAPAAAPSDEYVEPLAEAV